MKQSRTTARPDDTLILDWLEKEKPTIAYSINGNLWIDHKPYDKLELRAAVKQAMKAERVK